MGDVLESEAKLVTGRLQPGRSIDQDDSVVDEMFVAEFREEHLGHRCGSGRIESDVQQAIRRGIDRRVQLVPLVVDLKHGLVNCDVIRGFTVYGL